MPDLKAEALAWWVGAVSEQTLRRVMRGRLRRVLLWQIFRTIRQRARPDVRINGVAEFRIAGRRDGGIDRYRLALSEGRCTRTRNGEGEPALTLEIEPVSFLRLVGGISSPQRLLLARKLKLRGDLGLALALPSALRLPKRRSQTRSR